MIDVGELVSEASNRTMNFLFGAQRLLIEEIAFVRNEMLDQMNTETHLFNEFLSKMAQAHSVNDIRMMYEACGHFVRDGAARGRLIMPCGSPQATIRCKPSLEIPAARRKLRRDSFAEPGHSLVRHLLGDSRG
jgi:hypothetical protein